MKRYILLLLSVSVLMLVGSGVAPAQVAPGVVTDQADYSPGSTVSISGTGFQPYEPVRLLILQAAPGDNAGPEHQPWQVQADAEGRFQATWLVTTHEAGATLLLSATGLTSGRVAEATFTDGVITPASGGAAIPASTAGGSYTALSGPIVAETIVGDITVGTIVLTAPAGFVFDTNAPLPFITLAGDNNNKNINDLKNGDVIALAVTTNTLGFTVSTKSKGQTRNVLTYSNVRVRPIAPFPLASGNIMNTGNAVFPGSTTNFGTLTVVAGAAESLAVAGFPSPQTAGVPGSVTVTARDRFGNTVTGYTGTIHFTSTDSQAVLPADYTFVSGDNGTRAFSGGVTLKTLGLQSITVSNLAPASFTGAQTGIVINPEPATRLVFSVQPGSTVYGSALSPQPTVTAQDRFGNVSTIGLGTSRVVTLALTSGAGALLGTAALDIGTGAGNGAAAFANLTVNAAGAGLQLTASAPGLSNALSGLFAVAPKTLTASVTVSNKVYDGTASAVIATRALAGVLPGDNVTLAGGVAGFAIKTAGIGRSATVTGLGLAGADAGNYGLDSTTVSTTADITPASLVVTASAIDKIYDGTTAAITTLFDNRLAGDSLLVTSFPAAFTDKNVGNGKTVNVPGITLAGPDAENYSANTNAVATANITPAALTAYALIATRVYGATNPVFAVAYEGFVNGETSNVLAGALSVATVAGPGSPVGTYPITLAGQTASNYTLQYIPGTLTILPAPLVAAAHHATRPYGQPNPALTASLVGFVNGENTNALGGALSLSTSASAGSLPGDYPIIPAGLTSTNYSICFSNGVLTITSTNQPPWLAGLTNVTLAPGQWLSVKIEASDPNGDRVALSLDPGAPAGAVVTNLATGSPLRTTNTFLRWRPTRAQASTTNLITLRATDDGITPMSTAQTLSVVVLDSVEIALGSTNLQSGQSVAVPIYLASSEGVTNLDFSILWPPAYLANAALAAVSPALAAASLQDHGTNLVLSFRAAPGQALQGTQWLADLSFVAISNEFSAFVSLPIHDAAALKPDGSSYTNYFLSAATIAVVEGQPLLRASLAANHARRLDLYGRLGANYVLQSSTGFGLPAAWEPRWSYLQTNGVITIGVDSAPPEIFYRLVQP